MTRAFHVWVGVLSMWSWGYRFNFRLFPRQCSPNSIEENPVSCWDGSFVGTHGSPMKCQPIDIWDRIFIDANQDSGLMDSQKDNVFTWRKYRIDHIA